MDDLCTELLKEHSKAQVLKIMEYIGADQSKFDELIGLFLNDESRIAQRAAWAVSHCVESRPHLIQPHLENMVFNLKEPKLHDAVVRNTVKILAELDIPETLQGHIINIYFDYLLSQKTPVAVKAHAMQVVFNIARNEPDLLGELKMVIEEQFPYGSAGFKSRGKRILKDINKIINSQKKIRKER